MSTATADTAQAAETTMLICVDPKSNANKYYAVTLGADGTVTSRFGRVGEPGKPGVSGHGQAFYLDLIAKKRKRGYQETAIAGSAKASSLRGDAETKRRAQADLAGDSKDPRLASLIDRIVRVNAHEIAVLSGGKMTVRDGQVSTPLGLLTIDAVDEAGGLLDRLAKAPTDADLLSRYLTLVPQSVGRSRAWTESFFSGERSVDQQRQFLDQLRQSVQFAQTADAAEDGTDKPAERAFSYSLAPVDDTKVIREIEQMFAATRLAAHASSGMRVVNVYDMASPASEASFDKVAAEVGNVRRMWHGTRAFNVLSILASGMRVPDRTATNTAGDMFGTGLYFSEQSTKSLNYSRGGTWSSGVDRRCMMFVADVAMGWEYRPKTRVKSTCNDVLDGKVVDTATGKRFSSINVKAGTCGVRNHEAIVPGPSHVALRYLVEFEG